MSASGIGSCDYCGAIAAVAIRCACGRRVAYCGDDECRRIGAIAIEGHAEDCSRAAAALEPSPVGELLGDARLAELVLGRATVEVLPTPRLRQVAGGLVLEVGP